MGVLRGDPEAVRGTSCEAAIAPGNATTGTITFPLTAAWDGLEKTEEGAEEGEPS